MAAYKLVAVLGNGYLSVLARLKYSN
jgi:hypothetical protein